MEDYYKILEVNQSASPETIDKVYKILVKKYHPDLQDDKNKIQAEEKIKKINEAYDILSNPTKREEYNNTLIENNISYEKYNELINENILLKNELNYIKNKLNYSKNNVQENSTTSFKQNNSYYSSNNNQKNYNNYYNSNNYQKNKFEIKNIFKVIFSILITILIVTFIVINIPFIYNLFNSSMSILFVVLILFLFLSKK